MRRRGAITAIEDTDSCDHSDFLPPPSFYLSEDAFSDDDEAMDEEIDDFDA